MNKYIEGKAIQHEIMDQTKAEIAFGVFLEKFGVDCDAFMQQWKINQHQFNAISHYLHELTHDVSMLPPALVAVLVAGKQTRYAA